MPLPSLRRVGYCASRVSSTELDLLGRGDLEPCEAAKADDEDDDEEEGDENVGDGTLPVVRRARSCAKGSD